MVNISIKIFGVHFGNFVLHNSNESQFSKKNQYLKQGATLFEKKKRIVNQIVLSKPWYIG